MTVIIGMDPHKRSATVEAVDEKGAVLAAGRFGTDKAGYAQMLAAGRRFGSRVRAVEGCSGTDSSATDLTPGIGSSEKPHPGPAHQSGTLLETTC